jgi:ABC-2 type transport system ATP-binding protein
MATLHQPKMILSDEPFTGLSPHNITLVKDMLKLLADKLGITFIIVEQRVKECLTISSRVVSLKLGKVFSLAEVNSSFSIDELNPVFV